MDYDQLYTFITIARLQNFSRAAEELNVTQPTVAARIKNLEQEFNCKVFHRIGKKLMLTKEGEVLFSFANKAIQNTKNTKEMIAKIENLKLRIGFTPAFSFNIIYHALSLLQTHHHMSVTIFEGQDSFVISNKIKNDELDLGIVRDTISFDEELEETHISPDKLVFIVGKKHPLASKDVITREDLIDQNIVLFLRQTSLIIKIEQKLTGIKNLKIVEVSNFEMVKSFVRDGLGVSAIPYLAIMDKDSADDEILIKDFKDIEDISINIVGICKKNSKNKDRIKLFFDLFKQTLEN